MFRHYSTEALARASARHAWRTVAAWVLALVLAGGAATLLLGSALTSETQSTTDLEADRVQALLDERLPARPQVDEVIVVRSPTLTVDRAAFRAEVTRIRAALERLRGVAGVTDYYQSGDASLVSRDRRATLLPLRLARPGGQHIDGVVDIVRRADGRSGLDAAITGRFTANRDFMELAQRDLEQGELRIGAPAALLVLMIVFGALVAALLPLALAFVSIVIAVGLAAVIGQFMQLDVFVLNMITAMGLALGIDYTLFVLSRVREERSGGSPVEQAIAAAGATASRAVLFSGSAFVVAMLGMVLVPDALLRSLAVGAIVVGIVGVAAALTLLPAVVSLAGDRVNALRVPLLGRRVLRSAGREGRFWSSVARRVVARPVVSLLAATVVLLAAAAPTLRLETGYAGMAVFPAEAASRQGFDALQESFGESRTEPVVVAVDGDVASPRVRAGVARLRQLLRADGSFGPSTEQVVPSQRIAVVTAPLAGDSQSAAAYEAIRRVRADYVPGSFAGSGAEALVGGETASFVDYFDLVDRWLPIVIATVLGLTFVLLTVAFRSLLLPLQAIVLNLLSVGAAYGLIVLVFVEGVGNELLGFTQVDTVFAWVPLLLFSVLFGLSMDYNVFLLSRIRERYEATGDHAGAIAFGVGSTARLITGAALIIVAVFSGFAAGDLVSFQQMGFGIAVALLVDATVIRSVVVPAGLALLGERAWWLPRRLGWLPRFSRERDFSTETA